MSNVFIADASSKHQITTSEEKRELGSPSLHGHAKLCVRSCNLCEAMIHKLEDPHEQTLCDGVRQQLA